MFIVLTRLVEDVARLQAAGEGAALAVLRLPQRI